LRMQRGSPIVTSNRAVANQVPRARNSGMNRFYAFVRYDKGSAAVVRFLMAYEGSPGMRFAALLAEARAPAR